MPRFSNPSRCWLRGVVAPGGGPDRRSTACGRTSHFRPRVNDGLAWMEKGDGSLLLTLSVPRNKTPVPFFPPRAARARTSPCRQALKATGRSTTALSPTIQSSTAVAGCISVSATYRSPPGTCKSPRMISSRISLSATMVLRFRTTAPTSALGGGISSGRLATPHPVLSRRASLARTPGWSETATSCAWRARSCRR